MSPPRRRASRTLVLSLGLAVAASSLHAGCGGGGGGGARGAPNPTGMGAIGPAGGMVQVIGGALDGTSLSVPAGALAQTVTFALATGGDVTASTGFTPSGTAVKVTPDGQTFGSAATLVLTFDPALLPAGRTAADVRVLKRDDATGQLLLLTPSSTTARTVTVLVSSLSTFQPAVFVGGAPTITSASSAIGGAPAVVSVAGGETVTITGTNLFAGSTVSWNGMLLAHADVTAGQGGASLAVKAPAGAAGATVTLIVTQLPGGSATLASAFVHRELLVVTGQTPASNARLGPTETASVTVGADVDPTTLAAGAAALFSRGSVAAPATGSIALAGSRTLAFRPTQPIPTDGELTLGVDADLRSTSGLAATVQTTTFATAPTTDAVASALIQHSSSPAVTLRDGRVLVIGGKGPTPLAVATCYLYDPAAGTVIAAGSLNTARLGHSAVLLADGKVGVLGGHSGASVVTTVEVYDPATDAWTVGPTTLGRTTQQSVVPISGGRWLAVGGYPNVNFVATTPAQQTPEVLNATFSTCTASVVTSLLAGPAVVLPSGHVALFGNRFASVGTAEGQVLTIGAAGLADANVVTSAPIFSGALAGGAASDPSAARVATDDRILVQRATANNLVRVTYAGATPTGFVAQAGTSLPAARSRTATRLLALGDGSILIGPGGFSVSVTNPVADLFVPGALGSAGTLIPLDLRTGRRSYSAVLLKDGRAGLFGGRSGALSSGPEVQGLEVVSVEAAGQGSLSGMNLVALAASPASGFPIRPADTTVRFTLSGALDPATVIAANVTVTINATPASASVALQRRREVVVTLAPTATLAAGDALVVTLGGAIRDTEGRPLDTTRGVPSATWAVGP